MNVEMQALVGEPLTLAESLDRGYDPPTYEIARAIMHYRKNKKFPIPLMMNTKFYYYEADVGEVMTDEGPDMEVDSFTDVILCDRDGNELQKYEFRTTGDKMKVIK